MSAAMMKWIKVGVICSYLFLIVGLALYDEKLTPELAQDMAQPLPEIIEPGNVWIAFLGFDAPPGLSPYVYGEEKMRKHGDPLLATKKHRAGPRLVDGKKSEVLFRGKIPSFQDAKGGGMLSFAAAHQDEVAALSRNNEELLRRYEGLGKYPRYNEPLDYGFFATVPQYLPIKQACQTKLLLLASKIDEREIESALATLRDDAEFWRFVARSSTTLLSKLVAVSILKIHLRFTADLGAFRQLNGVQLAMIGDILRPFDKGEIGFAETLRGELRYVQQSLRLIWLAAKPWEFVTTLLYKPNATGNRFYANSPMLDCIRVAEMSPQRFALELKNSRDDSDNPRRMGIPFLYNPVGEVVWALQTPHKKTYSSYIAVGHDLEGFRRLSWLRVLSHTENISPEAMPKFLESHKTELGNPYTGAAMTWNPERLSISFSAFEGRQPVEIFL